MTQVNTDLSNVAVVLTTWNSERFFSKFPGPLLAQGIRSDQVLIMDSESKDRTVELGRSLGFLVHEQARHEFNHGGTRALAVELLPWADFMVYTTPDAIMASSDTLRTLVAAFDDPQVGAAFGRQLPHADADSFARQACELNYPPQSRVRSMESRKDLGFKAIFFSNNLGAYRRLALEAVGNFPARVITAEDSYTAARMMMAGWKTAYVAEAAVYHSHNQTLPQLFRRYFDTGVLHARESWMRKEFGEPAGEGLRFVSAEVRRLLREAPLQVPKVGLRTIFKFAGYQLGKREALLPIRIKRSIGNFHEFWA